MKRLLTQLTLGIVVLITVNLIAHRFFGRFDLTEDQRYTLSEAASSAASRFEAPVIIDVLLDGALPAEFRRLQTETQLLLQEFQSRNPKIQVNLVNPLADVTDRESTILDLQQLGLKPASVTIRQEGKTSQELVFPWAMVNYNNKTVRVPLLKNKLGASAEQRINNSVQNLEYAFADAFVKLTLQEKKKIAVLKGNGELEDRFLADYLTSIREYYNIGAITLDSVSANPDKVLQQLKGFDLALIAKPTEAFTEAEKYVLDQYIVQGGKSLWLIDQVVMERDSLFNSSGSALALPRELNLGDFFFKYGIRINPVLVNDLYNTPIVLATGEANDSQYNPLPWVYAPMVFSKEDHPINTNIEALQVAFGNSIDTLSNGYQKSVLFQSSPFSKTEGVPKSISLEILNTLPEQSDYPPGRGFPMAVLIEGAFRSAYVNRVQPVSLAESVKNGPDNKMVVIADGDLIKNQLRNGLPLELGFDKWTNSYYGNKEFLINCTNYLLDETGLLDIRSKQVTIPLLDVQKIADRKTSWRWLTIGVPAGCVLLLSIMIIGVRKQRARG